MIRTVIPQVSNLDWFLGLGMVDYHHVCIVYTPEFWDRVGLKDRYSIREISCRTVTIYNIVY